MCDSGSSSILRLKVAAAQLQPCRRQSPLYWTTHSCMLQANGSRCCTDPGASFPNTSRSVEERRLWLRGRLLRLIGDMLASHMITRRVAPRSGRVFWGH